MFKKILVLTVLLTTVCGIYKCYKLEGNIKELPTNVTECSGERCITIDNGGGVGSLFCTTAERCTKEALDGIPREPPFSNKTTFTCCEVDLCNEWSKRPPSETRYPSTITRSPTSSTVLSHSSSSFSSFFSTTLFLLSICFLNC